MKTYRLIRDHKASFNYTVGENIVSVTFDGGIRVPVQKRGCFKTNNPELIKVMENSVHFNNHYSLESDTTEAIAKTKKDTEEKKANEPEKKADATVVNEVASWAAGASYFRTKYPDEFDNKTSKADVIAAMEKYNVIFPNWSK